MHPNVIAALARNDGLIRRRDAMEAGLAEHEIDALLRTGTWVVVRAGVYALAEVWTALDPYVEQPRHRARAASLTMVTDHVLSHDSAARELGLALLRPSRELVHITRPAVRGSRTEHGVKHHGAVFRDEQVVIVNGIPVLDHARTTVDMAREHSLSGALPTFDSALRAGVRRAQLRQALEPMRCWPHVRRARACVDLADPGAESVGETLSRILLLELGIGPVETQFPVPLPTGTAWCDLRIGCHLLEFDGRLKYRRRESGGVADRPVEDVVWDERRRERDVCALGLGMSRLTWGDLWGRAREQAKDRIRREYAVTVARFGDVLRPDLEAFAQQMRAQRRRS